MVLVTYTSRAMLSDSAASVEASYQPKDCQEEDRLNTCAPSLTTPTRRNASERSPL